MINKISKYLIYLLVISIPFTHKEMFSIFDPDLVISKFFLIFVSSMGIFYFVKNYKNFIKDKLFLLLGSIVLFQILSLLQSRDLMNSVRMIAFQSAILFSYPTFKIYIESEKGRIKKLIDIYKYTFLLVFIFMLVQMYLQETFGKAIGGVWPVPGFPTRYGSVFWDVNHFGAYLSSLFFVVLSSAITEKGKFQKYINYFILFLILVALYFTSSRSATLGFGIAAISFLLVSFSAYKRLRLKASNWYWTAAGILSVSVPFLVLFFFQDIIRRSFLYRAVSFFSHLFLLKVGINVGLQNFLFGIGTNSFHAYFHTSKWANSYYYIDKAALSYKLPLHNLWLEVFAETGIFALVFFVLFWVLLLTMLIKSVSAKTKNLIPAGLFAGTVSFLIGGFMYSYKSEFFWIYVVIACSYATYHFNTDDIKLPKLTFDSLVVPFINLFSSLSLLLPLLSFMSPLTRDELAIIYSEKSSNSFIFTFQYLLDLFRYIFGNFSFTDRLIPLIFYVGSFLLLFGMFRRTCKAERSFVSTAIVFNVINLFNPGVYVSTKWIVCFFTLLLMHFVIKFIKLGGHFVCHIRWTNKVLYLVVLITSFFMALYSANIYKVNEHNSDLSFLAELASNRLLFENASVWVDSSVDLPLIHYYCDYMDKDVYRECKINVLSSDEMFIVNSPKILIIGQSDFVSKIKLVGSDYVHGENYLISGDYKMLVFD